MAPVSRELTMQSEPIIPNARAFVRSLNVLLKYARLYGLEHSRSAGQFDSAWSELQAAVNAAGPGGLLLGASGSQLLLDGVPLESSPAERSFADFLNASGVASIGFLPRVEREEFSNLVKCFMESGPKAATLSDRLAVFFAHRTHSGIRVNEIRFVAEDSGFSDARVAATLTAKTLGADADRIQEWFRSPEKMIQLDCRCRRRTWWPRRSRQRWQRRNCTGLVLRGRKRHRHRRGIWCGIRCRARRTFWVGKFRHRRIWLRHQSQALVRAEVVSPVWLAESVSSRKQNFTACSGCSPSSVKRNRPKIPTSMRYRGA